MKALLNGLTILGVLIGGWLLLDAFIFEETAALQTASATMAIAFAVLPYCLARAIENLMDEVIDD